MATHFPLVFQPEDPGAPTAPMSPPCRCTRRAAREPRPQVRLFEPCVRISRPIRKSSRVREVQVAKVSGPTNRFARPKVNLVTAAALVGRCTSVRKAASSRAHGRLGGRDLRAQ